MGEKRKEEEALAKKFGLSGFGSNAWSMDDEEEDGSAEGSASRKSSLASEDAESQSRKSSMVEEQAASEDLDGEEVTIQDQELETVKEEPEEEDIVQDSVHEAEPTVEEKPAENTNDLNETQDSTIAETEPSWHESEISSGATIETEVNKDGTVTETEEEVKTKPSSSYVVTESYEHEEDGAKTVGQVTTIEGEKEYTMENEDGSTTTGSASFKASVEEQVTTKKSGFDMPSIEIDDESSSSKRAVSSMEEEESSSTRRSTTTTVTEETETRRTLKQKASIDTHDHEIIIYNKDGVEITRVTHGDVIVGFDKVDEVVMVKNGLLTVSHENGDCLVKITDGEKQGTGQSEVNVYEFDGEVVVRSLIDLAHKYLVPKRTERKLSIHDINASSEE